MTSHNRPRLLILAGPSAVGKTEASLTLAKRLNGEIISADSAQVYRRMDIGTAKLPLKDRRNIPHYMIDILEPWQDFSAKLFCDMAKAHILEINSRGKLPILAGGTGFYIRALIYGASFGNSDADGLIRARLQGLEDERGLGYLHALLKERDPAYADLIPKENTKRIIRALEYIELTGKKFSDFNEAQKQLKSPYDFKYIVLTMDMPTLYERINKRVDEMMEKGLLDEVRRLADEGISRQSTSMQAIGYKEILAYLNGECSLDEAVCKIKLNTRHFAKRQMTWFRKEREVNFVQGGCGVEEIVGMVKNDCN